LKIDPQKADVGKPASGTIKLPDDLKKTTCVVADVNVQFFSDRGYELKELPKAMIGGSLLVREASYGSKSFPKNKVIAEKDCTLYMAVMTKYNGQIRVTEKDLKRLADQGWTKVEERFSTTAPEKEVWEWSVYSLPIKKGELAVPSSDIRTTHIFIFN